MSMLPMDMKPEHIICYDKSFCKNDPISLSYEGGNHYKALISCGHHFSGSRPGERELPPLRGGCQERGVVVRCERLRCTRLQHRTCKTRRGHFASHGLSAHGLSTERARLAGGTSLRSWFQQKCLQPGGDFDFSRKSSIFKIQVGFLST